MNKWENSGQRRLYQEFYNSWINRFMILFNVEKYIHYILKNVWVLGHKHKKSKIFKNPECMDLVGGKKWFFFLLLFFNKRIKFPLCKCFWVIWGRGKDVDLTKLDAGLLKWWGPVALLQGVFFASRISILLCSNHEWLWILDWSLRCLIKKQNLN